MTFDPNEDITIAAMRMNAEEAQQNLLRELRNLRCAIDDVERDASKGARVGLTDTRRVATDAYEVVRYAIEFTTLLDSQHLKES